MHARKAPNSPRRVETRDWRLQQAGKTTEALHASGQAAEGHPQTASQTPPARTQGQGRPGCRESGWHCVGPLRTTVHLCTGQGHLGQVMGGGGSTVLKPRPLPSPSHTHREGGTLHKHLLLSKLCTHWGGSCSQSFPFNIALERLQAPRGSSSAGCGCGSVGRRAGWSSGVD